MMNKLVVMYSTRDRMDLASQTFPPVSDAPVDVIWADASTKAEDLSYFMNHACRTVKQATAFGGADVAIAWKLSEAIRHSEYTHIMILEDDVLLDQDWYEPTMALFDKGERDGLEVGAVSPRSYVDRVLIQRDGYAVMHNIGAGAIIFTRAAAEIVLRNFRTAWWPDSVRLFAMLSGIDLRTYAAFRGNEQWTTVDWGWEAQLARHGLASLALTPAKCHMIGQDHPLELQGLRLTEGQVIIPGTDNVRDFNKFVTRLETIRDGHYVPESPGMIHRDGSSMLLFPHQMKAIPRALWFGNIEHQRSQGFGPFAYRAGEGGMSLSVHISGPCLFLITGGINGAGITIEDRRSGFKASPALPPDSGQPISIQVPGGPVPPQVTCDFEQGAVFYGLSCSEPQMIDTTFMFSWDQLPRAT